MDLRRYILFIVLATAILFGWNALVVPRFLPPAAKQAADADKQPAGDQSDASGQEASDPDPKQEAQSQPTAGTEPDASSPDDPGAEQAAGQEPEKTPPTVEPAEAQVVEFDEQTVTIGSADPNSGYFLAIEVSSQGATVASADFNDPRYVEAGDRKQPLRIVGRESAATTASFAAAIEPIDRQLAALEQDGTQKRNWELRETIPDEKNPEINRAVVFALKSPDGKAEYLKRFQLDPVPVDRAGLPAARDNAMDGYLLHVSLTMRNLGDEPLKTYYQLQGPVGVPLDNRENTRKYRDFKIGVIQDETDYESATMSASELADNDDEQDVEFWRDPLRYVGLDMQYFAILMVPAQNQFETPYTDSVRPVLLERHPGQAEWSEIGLLIESRALEVAPSAETTHEYFVFIGPKRESLLRPLAQSGELPLSVQAEEILDYGMFWWVARGMLWMLNSLHGFGIPYGIAIICLTIVVRGCMFPLSRKQALNAEKMKELQPKLAELKKKYAKDKEKFARAQMELFQKNKFNPLAGCLPLIVQLPIFISLYTALSSSVDLRMASFLYIDDLSSPDRLIPNWLGFSLPIVGRDLNLLPLITIVLFQVQQKLYMPPPADEQQAAQQKMMSFMMIIFGVMFYNLPAGLCVYFIASSLWGMGERKLLKFTTGSGSSQTPAETSVTRAGAKK